MTHFTDIELQRWRESGPGDQRERVAGHLAECGGCARRFADAIRAQPLAAEPASDAAEFIAAGRNVPSPRPRWIVPLAAAAMLVIALVATIPVIRRQTTPDLHLRGAVLQPLSPAGSVTEDAQFVWSSGISATRFRIEVRNADRLVYRTEALRPPVAMPSTLPRGVEYSWTVTALDDQGRAVGNSKPRVFTIRQ